MAEKTIEINAPQTLVNTVARAFEIMLYATKRYYNNMAHHAKTNEVCKLIEAEEAGRRVEIYICPSGIYIYPNGPFYPIALISTH